jgi:DNA-binding response OmpR family regulator
LGKGSTFRVRLPLDVAQETSQQISERVDTQQTSLNVLVVEGDAMAAHAIGEMLEQEGHRVRYANHGLNALAELAVAPCDVMLLQLNLPGVDGFQVAQLIRHGEVVGEHVPIVAMSARDDDEIIQRGLQIGIDAFLHQPLIGAQLASAIRDAMAMRAAVSKEPKKMNLA